MTPEAESERQFWRRKAFERAQELTEVKELNRHYARFERALLAVAADLAGDEDVVLQLVEDKLAELEATDAAC